MGISNHVLYLEPDPSVADRASAVLGDVAPALELTRVATAEEVRRRLDDDWDCLVVEWNLPDEDAYELVTEVRRRRPSLPVVVFTGAGPESVVEEAYDAGATDYLRKEESGEGQYLVFARRVRSAAESARGTTPPAGAPETVADVRSDAIVTVDAAGLVRFANAGVETVFGYDPEELVGESLSRVLPTESVPASGSERAREPSLPLPLRSEDGARGGERATVRGRRRDGAEVPLEASFDVTSRNGERFVTAVLRDVSDRRRLQAELDEVLGRVADGFLALDDDWRFTYLNSRAEELLGRREEELLGEVVWDAFSEWIDEAFRRRYERVVERQEPEAFEEYFPPMDRWLEVHAYPSETGLSVYFRDVTGHRRREQTLTALHGATRRLLRVDGKPRVAEVVVDAVTDVLELPYSCVYLFARSDTVLVPAAWSDEFEAAAGAPSAVHNGDDSPVWDAFVRGEAVSPTDWFEDGDSEVEGAFIPLGDHGVLAVGSPRAEPFESGRRELVDLLASTAESVLDRAERETRLRKREREVQQQNRQLSRLNRINDLIRRVDQTLVAAETREEIEETVCEMLVRSDHVEFAWFGSVGSGRNLVPRAWAGENAGYLDAIDVGSAAPSDVERAEPSRVAAHDREPVVVENVGSDLGAGDWRREALSRGYTSVLSVPLLHDDYRYGVLTMYADRSDAFDDLSRAVFEELGRTIAYAINAVETKRGFLANRVVELELRLRGDEDPLQRLAAAAETTIEFEGTVPGPDPDSSVVYFTTDAATDALSRLAEDVVSVRDLRFVAGEEDGLFQATVTGPLLATRIVDGGGVPRSIVVEPDSIRTVVDLPHTADVRSFVESLEAGPADVDLLARGERERPVHTRRGFRTEFESSLTARQREVLRTAYLAGYFESPRRSTGQEVGAALGISQPTVAHHLRIGLRKLLSLLYEDGVAERL